MRELEQTDAQEQRVRKNAMSRRIFVRMLGATAGIAAFGVASNATAACNGTANSCVGDTCVSSNLCTFPANTCTGKGGSPNTCSGSNSCATSNEMNCQGPTGGNLNNTCNPANTCTLSNDCTCNTCGTNACGTNVCHAHNTCTNGNICSTNNFCVGVAHSICPMQDTTHSCYFASTG